MSLGDQAPDVDALREDLLELVRDVRTWVGWQASTGADGLIIERRGAAPRAAEPALAEEAAAPPRAEPAMAPLPAAPTYAAPDFERPRPAAVAAARATVSVEDVPLLAEGDRRSRLLALAEEVAACKKCGLCAARTQTVFARGNPMAEICFVGEGPGADEDAFGEPFVGKAGQLLDKMIVAMGLSRDDVYVCNVVKCRPPENRTPEPSEMATCLPYLTEQLELVRPKAIVALGSTALRGLLGSTEGITRARGTWKLYPTANPIPVMPTFHPAYVLRNPSPEVKGQVWSDLKRVLVQVGRALPVRPREG